MLLFSLKKVFLVVFLVSFSLVNTAIVKSSQEKSSEEIHVMPPIDETQEGLRNQVVSDYIRARGNLNSGTLEHLLQSIAHEAHYFIDTHGTGGWNGNPSSNDPRVIGTVKHHYAKDLLEGLMKKHGQLPGKIKIECDYGHGGSFAAKADVALEDGEVLYFYDYKFGESGFNNQRRRQIKDSITKRRNPKFTDVRIIEIRG